MAQAEIVPAATAVNLPAGSWPTTCGSLPQHFSALAVETAQAKEAPVDSAVNVPAGGFRMPVGSPSGPPPQHLRCFDVVIAQA